MNMQPAFTLDQLAAFVAVAETSSFSKAARALSKVQSAVSYSIKSLEEQLDVQLFERSTRHVALTEEGRVLLDEACAILRGTTQLSAIASQFSSGIEARVNVAVDIVYPSRVFARLASEFRQRFGGVHLHVTAGMLGSVIRDLESGRIHVGLTGMPNVPPGLSSQAAGMSALVAVASPDHPLAAFAGPIPAVELDRHLQLVIEDPTEMSAEHDFNVLSARTWRLGDMALRREMMLAGVGWGRMPVSWVEHDLQQKRLVSIRPEVWAQRVPSIEMRVLTRADRPPGPAGAWWATERAKRGAAWEREVAAVMPRSS